MAGLPQWLSRGAKTSRSVTITRQNRPQMLQIETKERRNHHNGDRHLCGGFGLALSLDRDDVIHRPILGGDLTCGNNRCVAEVRELNGRHHAKFTGVRDYEAFGGMAHRDTLDLRFLDIRCGETLLGGDAIGTQKPQLKL